MSAPDSFKEQPYWPVRGEETDSEFSERSPFIKSTTGQNPHYRLVWPWILSTVSLASVLAYVLFQQQNDHWSQSFASESPAFRTDLHDAHPHILYEERVFSGKLWFNESTETVYRDIDPSETQYFGPPTPEIDAAWANLLRGNSLSVILKSLQPPKPFFDLPIVNSICFRRICTNDCGRSGTVHAGIY